MDSRVRRVTTILRAVLTEARTERVTFLAASIAYHAFVSLLPLLLFLLLVLTAIGSESIERNVLALVEGALTPGAAAVLFSELRSAGQSAGLSILGFLVLVWGTLRIFRGLDTAFSDIYETGGRNTFLDQLRDGVIVLGCVAAAITVAATIDGVVSGSTGGTAGWVLRRVLFVAGLSAVLLPMYYVFPDERNLRVREVVPGVAFAAVGLTLFESLFGLYIQFSSQTAEASTLGAILVFLTWLYFSSLVVLLGVVVNAVLSGRSHDVDLKPVFAVPAAARDGSEDELLDAIRRFETLPGADSVTLVVDDDAGSIPPPEEVHVRASRRSTDVLGENPSVTLRWARRGDGD
jgi:membrane protein